MSDYRPVETLNTTRRLMGWSAVQIADDPTQLLANHSACLHCGAPKGFLCKGWIPAHASCEARWRKWKEDYGTESVNGRIKR